MYKQEPYLSEYIDVRAGVYFKPFYNVLADCGVRKLKSSLTDMRETYSENIYADFTQYLAEQLQEICMRTLIVEMHICKSAGKLKGENNREEYEYYCNKIVGEMVNIKKIVNTDQTEHTARRFSAWLPPIQCTLSGHQCMLIIQV